MTTNYLEYEITKLSPKPDDLLVLQTESALRPDAIKSLKDFVDSHFPGVLLCVLAPGASLSKLSPNPGDLLILNMSEEYQGKGWAQKATGLRSFIDKNFPGVKLVVSFHMESLSQADPEQMRAAGWVRTSIHHDGMFYGLFRDEPQDDPALPHTVNFAAMATQQAIDDITPECPSCHTKPNWLVAVLSDPDFTTSKCGNCGWTQPRSNAQQRGKQIGTAGERIEAGELVSLSPNDGRYHLVKAKPSQEVLPDQTAPACPDHWINPATGRCKSCERNV